MRWTRYAGWINVVAGIATGAVMVAVGLGAIGVITGLVMVGSGVFMIWLGAGWDKPLEDLSELHKYGRPANAIVLAVDDVTLDGSGGRTARLKLNVAPVNESDFITTRTLELPGGKVPSVGETVTVKFDPQSRKNVILLEQAYMVEDPMTATRRMIGGSGPTTLALAALLVLALAVPASAAVKRMAQVPADDVELAGPAVVFSSPSGGTQRIYFVDLPDGALTKLREFTIPGGDDDECCQTFFTSGFSASDKRVAVSGFYEAYVKGALAQSDYDLQVGPPNGPLSQLFKCGGNHPYDVDGDRIAYLGDDCTEKASGGPRVVTRDLATGAVVGSFAMTRQPNTLDLAGDLIALSGFFAAQPEVVIHNTAGAEQYKLNHNFAQYSLQADGKIALARTEELSADCRIEWFSKAEPTPHRIEFCPRGRVRMAGDRIAFDRIEGTSVSLNVTTLTGQRRAFTFFDPGRGLGGFDFDGSRMAYTSRGCVRAEDTVWVDDLSSPEVDSPVVEGGPCTATIDTKTARASSKGLVRVKVTCPDGCAGDLNLYQGKNQVNTRPSAVSIRSGRSRTIPVRLNTLRDLRKFGSRVYQARVSVEQRSAPTRTFKRAVRVLRPK
jgi:hypothetical protein